MTLPFLGRTASLSDQVADVLAERVLTGMWPAGHRIPSEPELVACVPDPNVCTPLIR